MLRRGVVVIEDVPSPAPWRPLGAFEEVANRPIVHHVLDGLLSAGVEHLVVACSSAHAEQARRSVASHPVASGIPTYHVEREAPVDFLTGIALAAHAVGGDPCVIHGADGLLGEPLGSIEWPLNATRPDAVMVVHHGPGQDGRLSAASRRMPCIRAWEPRRPAVGMARVLLLGAGAVEPLLEESWWGAAAVDLDVAERSIEAAGGSLRLRSAEHWRRCCGEPVDLLELNRVVLDRMEGEPGRIAGDGNRIQGRVLIEPGASVRDSVIIGPSVIAAGARVANAYIGPYTSIGAGARIEGAEIEQSIICPGVTIAHIGCRLTGSLVGRDARIFRDFTLPRALRLHVGEGTEVALSQ